MNITGSINNQVKNEILEEIKKKKPIVPNIITKTTSIPRPEPIPRPTTNSKPEIPKKEIIKKEKTLNYNKTAETVLLKSKKKKTVLPKVENSSDQKIFEDYKEELKYIIQKKATQNYPRISLRKKEQGTVELIFSIDFEGNIKNINIGKNTKAPKRLINSSKNTLESISPYKKNNILKKKNTFSIIIVYKLN